MKSAPPPPEIDPRPYEIEVRAPRGFRPSDWPERLMNSQAAARSEPQESEGGRPDLLRPGTASFDECAELGVDVLYTRFTPEGVILVMRAELADPKAKNAESCALVLDEILGFVRKNQLSLSIDPRLETVDPRLRKLLGEALARAQVPMDLVHSAADRR